MEISDEMCYDKCVRISSKTKFERMSILGTEKETPRRSF